MACSTYYLLTLFLGAVTILALITLRSLRRNEEWAQKFIIRLNDFRVKWRRTLLIIALVALGWSLNQIYVQAKINTFQPYRGNPHLVTLPLFYLIDQTYGPDLPLRSHGYKMLVGSCGEEQVDSQDVEPIYSLEWYWTRVFVGFLCYAVACSIYFLTFPQRKQSAAQTS